MIEESQALAKLERYKGRFVQAVKDTFSEWEQMYGPLRLDHEAGTRTALLHDLLVKHLKVQFADVPGVTFPKVRGRTLMAVDNDFISSIKKLDKSLRSSNIPTQQAMDFLYQQPLPGLEPATNIIFGYTYNDTFTGWDAIWVTVPNGPALAFKWCLARANEPQNLFDFPTTDTQSQSQPIKRLRRKDKMTQEDKDATDSSS